MNERILELKIVDLQTKRPQWVRVMVFQHESNLDDWKKEGALFYPNNIEKFKKTITCVLKKAKESNVKLLVFPELSVPFECISLIVQWSKKNNTIVIGGSHYLNNENTIIARCPIVYNNITYYTEKIDPAPDEIGNTPTNKGLSNGDSISIFKNTPIGNFAVFICSDYLNETVKEKIKNEDLDFWIITAFQRKSDWHYTRMILDVESVRESRYLIYSNNLLKDHGDGNSAFFGTTYSAAIDEFKHSGYSDGKDKWKLVSLDIPNNYFIIEADINYKRPAQTKFPSDGPNIKVIEKNKLNVFPETDGLNNPTNDNKNNTRNTIKLSRSTIDEFHKFIVDNYLKKELYFPFEKNDALFNKYSNAFAPVISIKKGEKLLNLNYSQNLFLTLANIIEKSESQNPLFVNGYAGCGKTAFLSVLYLFMHSRYSNSHSNKLPILINLHYYNKFIYLENIQKISSQAVKKITEDLNKIFNYIKQNPKLEVIIIIDGADEYINPKVDLDDFITSEIEKLKVKTKIIGLRKHKEEHNRTQSKSKTFPLIEDPEIELELSKINIESENYGKFIDAFAEIESLSTGKPSSTIKEYLHEKIQKFKIDDVDFFLVIILSKGIKADFKFGKAKSFSSFLKVYIEECKLNVSKSAELAFKIFNHPEKVTDKEKNQEEWWKIQKHESIRDFLVAYNIVEKLVLFNQKNREIFNFVYPYDLNNFCKEIINDNVSLQNKAFNSIISLMSKVELTAQTHFCYLLGRFEDNTIKEKAKAFLRSIKPDVDKSINEKIPFDSTKILNFDEKELLLFHRTIYISLTYLGDIEASNHYIRQLLYNRYFDNLNRGFHLEYYEDIVFEPSSKESLKHEDNLNDFNKTYNRLYKKLELALNEKDYYSMFQIELYTLCSLAQHRQAYGNLNDNKRNSILKIISKTLKNIHNLEHEFFIYLKFIVLRFDVPGRFNIASFSKDLYLLKSLNRKGWVKRGINNSETVASHIYGAFMLAYLHLPNDLDGFIEYNKSEILKMILIHDLGEAYIGDLTPDEKTEESNKLEERQFEYLSLIGNYDGLSSIPNLANLFRDFTYERNNINCILAREIDKLDNLLQLYIYNSDDKIGPIEDFEEFRADLIGEITTDIGHQIMKNIEELFE
jgi:5'-deoxynucleotidase YfbR-like HD superfamily hydrolase/predicted amidohydrolase